MVLHHDDFKFDLIEEARRLRYETVAHTRSAALDPKTAFWVIRMDAWREFMRSVDYMNTVKIADGKRRNELLGLPVRLTVDDEPDTPMVQLVMEPLLVPRDLIVRKA